MVTIDVGGGDIVGCGLSGTINPSCVTNALAAVDTNLPIIMSGLRAAGGDVRTPCMTYYDPLPAWLTGGWFHGSASQKTAR